MEANKDAAFHYIELAEKAILANDNERALRYLNKSERLFPTQKAKGKSSLNFVRRGNEWKFHSDLLERLMHTNSYSSSTSHQKSEDQSTSNNHTNNHSNHSSTTRQRSNTNTTSQTSPSSDYTAEEAAAVRK